MRFDGKFVLFVRFYVIFLLWVVCKKGEFNEETRVSKWNIDKKAAGDEIKGTFMMVSYVN